LYRFDSIIPLKGNADYDASEFTTLGLKQSLVKMTTIKEQDLIKSNKKITFNDIIKSNEQGHDLPLYNNKREKGLYKTFEDFKLNAISVNDYEFKKGQMGDIIFIKENGNEFPMRSIWGFCDGKDLYINSGDKYSKLIQSGYNFYFSGTKGLQRNSEHIFLRSSALNYATDTGLKKITFDISIRYYQLDMENGAIY